MSVKHWKLACGMRGNSIEARFREELGCTLHQYLSRRRLETAAALLLEPKPRVTRIASLLGYSSLAAFSRAFNRWMGMRPKRYRETEGSLSTSSTVGRRHYSAPWRQVLLARSDLIVTNERYNTFHRVYIQAQEESYELPQPSNVPDYEKREAEKIWNGIKDRPYPEQAALLSMQVDFKTTALFDLLHVKSREEGRKNRLLGVQMAELALQSLGGCAKVLGDDLPNRQAQGWIAIANARRLNLDFIGAERDFSIAHARWTQARDPDPVVEAEFHFYKACLKWFQMAIPSATALVNRAVSLSRQLGQRTLLAQSLILRTALKKRLGQLNSMVSDIREALDLIDIERDPYLALCAYTTLTTVQLRLNEPGGATDSLDKARELSGRFDFRLNQLHLHWLEGLVESAKGATGCAEISYKRALHECVELEEREFEAVISIDLAILKANCGDSAEALLLASRAIPVLEAVKIDRNALRALRLLRGALLSKEVNEVILSRVRDLLELILDDPVSWVARRHRSKSGAGKVANPTRCDAKI